MGNPATSAVRAETATNTAALSGAGEEGFGSLTGLGGPKKFKKKPVLVLDPEELERAHMMFQEASAEMLGEEVERAPKPAAPTLGLAPMDDEDATPEDMGLSDDDQDGGDDEAIPTAEDLLKMTSSRPVEDEAEQEYAMRALEEGFDEEHRIFPTLPVLPEEEIDFEQSAEAAGSQLPADESDAAPEEPVEAAYEAVPEAVPTEEPSFKLSPLNAGETEPEDEDEEPDTGEHFAALSPEIRRETPIRPQEAAEAAEEPALHSEPHPAPLRDPEPLPEVAAEPEPVPEAVPEPEPEQLEIDPWDNEPAPIPEEMAPLPAAEPEAQPEPEVHLEAEPENEPEAEPTATFEPGPRLEDAPDDLPATPHIGPFEHQRAAKSAEDQQPVSEAAAPVPGFTSTPLPPVEPAPEARDELPPIEPDAAATEPETPQEEPEYIAPPRPVVAEDGPRWQPEGYDAPEDLPEMADSAVPEFEQEGEHFDENEEEAGNYTVIEDEPVDGYAFMYANNPRGRAVRAAAPGEANSLRARLIREREEQLAEAESAANSGSVVSRFWNWLRGLFS